MRSFVRRNEFAAISVIVLFIALYAMRMGCLDAGEPDPSEVMTVQPVDPTYYPPVNPVTVQPYPTVYPAVYPPGGAVHRACITGACSQRSWKKPNYRPREPIRNFFRFLFVPRWRR